MRLDINIFLHKYSKFCEALKGVRILFTANILFDSFLTKRYKSNKVPVVEGHFNSGEKNNSNTEKDPPKIDFTAVIEEKPDGKCDYGRSQKCGNNFVQFCPVF